MSIKDFVVKSDKFEHAIATGICFPCFACVYCYRDSDEPPCNACGHNLTDTRLEEDES